MNYKQISESFWTDSKVDDEFTPEDKYFYLYLLTNPHTSLCGCYEISVKQMERETGYNKDTVMRLIDRMENQHDVIRYDAITKEILLLNWSKYNWTKSDKVHKALEKIVPHIKSQAFRSHLKSLIRNRYIETENETETDNDIDIDIDNDIDIDTDTDTDVSIGYEYPMDRVSKKKKETVLYFPGYPDVEESFSDYIKARKQIKATMSDKAKTLAANKLRKMCTDSFGVFDTEHAIELINEAIEHGWKSFYETKKGNNSKKSGELEGWLNA